MKFEIEETTVTTVIQQVEAENASEAEEKEKKNETTVIKKTQQTNRDIRPLAVPRPNPPQGLALNKPPIRNKRP